MGARAGVKSVSTVRATRCSVRQAANNALHISWILKV
jgi:hypothetical protein